MTFLGILLPAPGALTLNALVLLVAYLAETSEKGDTLHHSGHN